MRKFISVLCVILLVLGVGTTAFAGENVIGTATVEDGVGAPFVLNESQRYDNITDSIEKGANPPTANWNWNSGHYLGRITMVYGGWTNYRFQANSEGRIYVKCSAKVVEGSGGTPVRFVLTTANGSTELTTRTISCPGSDNFYYYGLTPGTYYSIHIVKAGSAYDKYQVDFTIGNSQPY